MEILFKSVYSVFYIEYNRLYIDGIGYQNVDLSNVTHLDDAEVLYHYRDNENGDLLPVYYEHNNSFITVSKISDGYLIFNILDSYTKDYTLANLKLLEDGNII